jgi:dolichol-phosphate mannosyltransferase
MSSNVFSAVTDSVPEVSLVVPVYKEEPNIRPFLVRAESVFDRMRVSYEIIFALDPSPDKTEEIIQEEIIRNPNIKLVVFSRRFGQPAATMGGISSSSGKYVVLIDVDLQDPPELIENMYAAARKGAAVVYARRVRREGETAIKKLIAKVGSALIQRLSEVPIPKDVGEFRMMSRRVVNELLSLRESHGFIRGLVAYVGFKQEAIEFVRDSRQFEEAKYNRFTGSIKIGLNGLIGFSARPLQLMSIAGGLIAFFSFLLGVLYVVLKLLGATTPGLATIVLFVSFFSGIQLMALGLMGEYVGRIYDEVKGRPQYIVDKKINFKE